MNDIFNMRLTRRTLLKGGGSTLMAMTILPGGMIVGASNSWASTPKTLAASDFATLVQVCRDIYPHDHLADSFYAKVVEGLDAAATESADEKSVLEAGIAALNQSAQSAHSADYGMVAWEIDRVNILRNMQGDAFFQKLRGSLVTGIYNNPEVWPLFGYEGESASQGGYLNRGFDDIDWLDQV